MDPKCTCGSLLTFCGTIAAPGVGQSWECESCGKPYVKIGTSLIDVQEDVDPNREPPWVSSAADILGPDRRTGRRHNS